MDRNTVCLMRFPDAMRRDAPLLKAGIGARRTEPGRTDDGAGGTSRPPPMCPDGARRHDPGVAHDENEGDARKPANPYSETGVILMESIMTCTSPAWLASHLPATIASALPGSRSEDSLSVSYWRWPFRPRLT